MMKCLLSFTLAAMSFLLVAFTLIRKSRGGSDRADTQVCLYSLTWSLWITTLTFVMAPTCFAAQIPPSLSQWQTWVLHDHQEALCPSDYNDATTVRCQWPSQLELDVSSQGAQFEQRWLMFAPGWAALPGGGAIWPESIIVDGSPVAVISRDNRPVVRLSPGEHRIMGRFVWSHKPEMMHVPPAIGLFSLSVEGREVLNPILDDQGQVWLQPGGSGILQEDSLKVRVFRLINDSIPLQVTTLLRLDVSGNPRETELADVLLGGSTPMAIHSPLPARIHADGRLIVQLRPGQWELYITTRRVGPQYKISAGPCSYGNEIWSFQPQHTLRLVEILEVPPVEPTQTDMPVKWRSLQAYLITPHSNLVIKEIRRGNPEPAADQLSLERVWWLDFDGRGFTVHDVIEGTLSRQWHLAVNPPMQLGRVVADGVQRVITEQGPQKKMGVELRHGSLNLEADIRIARPVTMMSAVGWDHDFQSVIGTLHLPPGWRLFTATGVDQVSDCWLLRWTLLDFFLVLIIALSLLKLRSWKSALIGFLAMVLTFHEPDAPRWVWLHILAVLALLPVLPDGWVKRAVQLWWGAAVAVLLLICIPFVVNQIHWGVYPQLAPAGSKTVAPYSGDISRSVSLNTSRFVQDKEALSAPVEESPVSNKPTKSKLSQTDLSKQKAVPMIQAPQSALQQQDPKAIIPTGPGLPRWHWQATDLRWSGPVAKTQQFRLYLLSPAVNRVLAIVRVVLLLMMVWSLLDWRMYWRYWGDRLGIVASVITMVICAGVVLPKFALADEVLFPPTDLLQELRRRLLEKPDCFPQCADISRLELIAQGNDLQLLLKVSSADRMAVPLPVNGKSWAPRQILMDNAPISGLTRDANGQLWAMIPPGLHTVLLKGDAGQERVIRIPLPLKPHMATFTTSSWRLAGIHEDGTTGSSLQLTRLPNDQAVASSEAYDESPMAGIAPFLHVERVLHLGLTWQTTTTIRRMNDTGVPVVVSLPLLAGESITTEGIRVEQGAALVNMAANESVLTYEAVLAIESSISLSAPRTVPWTETWILEASTVWHCDFEGIPVVHHQERSGQWQPQWRPWPGETVTIHVHRPKAILGQSKTIDRVRLITTPGLRSSQAELTMTVRTSRGGPHTITLPPKTNLQLVTVDNKTLPIRQNDDLVTVPLSPGQHQVAVQWHQLSSFGVQYKTPQVNVGQSAVNTQVTLEMPAQRWILMTWGPKWGPAVLFWSYLFAIVLAAFVLGRTTLTPLKFWQWLLLGLGLTQIPTVMTLLIVIWLFALALRERLSMPQHWLAFNGIQVVLGAWTLAALVALFAAVKNGLIGMPEMQIVGNHSSHLTLNWMQDRISGELPRATVLSVPIWVYRLLMLVWALWLAMALLKWLTWGWHCLAKGGLWRKRLGKKVLSKEAP